MQMNRRFYLIPRDKKFSYKFSVRFSVSDSSQPASGLLSEQQFDKREQKHTKTIHLKIKQKIIISTLNTQNEL